MVAVFVGYSQTIILGVDKHGDIIDKDGRFFGPNSGRNIRHYQRQDIDLKHGASIHISSTPNMRFFN